MILSPEQWMSNIFSIESHAKFEVLALDAFQFQYQHIAVYRDYCKTLKINPTEVKTITQIPFLPVEFFKTHRVIADNLSVETIFTSSGTTGMETSKHLVHNISVYENSFLKGFNHFYGSPSDYCILALLPSYLEREGSSLVYMANRLIQESGHPNSGFYLNNLSELATTLKQLSGTNQKTILLGVTYALLDLAEQFPMHIPKTLIMETGGMKGRRKELIREELHYQLCQSFGVTHIHSEYGMTELLSQGYSKGEGIFQTPPWMKIYIRDTYDPFSYLIAERSGGINVIDLANIYSCCFIETKDLGKTHTDGTFSVLGRFDNSDIRGCNLMVG
ncbi:MAG: acyltransferase [Salinivirgaceae bacterium]|jgi:phenylacetate-coenzyme A ligase PaaK-like adenylate-forming protein